MDLDDGFGLWIRTTGLDDESGRWVWMRGREKEKREIYRQMWPGGHMGRLKSKTSGNMQQVLCTGEGTRIKPGQA